MSTKKKLLAASTLAVFLAVGCASDVAKQLTSDPHLQSTVMDTIIGNGGLASQITDRLIASDSTRTMLVDKLMSNAGGAQGVMSAVAKSPSMVDGVIGLAVQDSAMKSHLLTLMKGMQMGAHTK
jgi:hypothetical protein